MIIFDIKITMITPKIASEIELASSIIGILDGSESFTILNKFFNDNCKLYDASKDDIGQLSLSGSEGFRLKSPRIAIKNTKSKTFGCWPVIAWRHVDDNYDKQYFIMNPGDERFKDLYKSCHFKLIVNPNNKETPFLEEDEKLIGFEYQVLMATECLILAYGFEIDLKKYDKMYNNKEFLTAFKIDILNKIKAKTSVGDSFDVELNDKFIESFNNPPLYKTLKNKSIITVSEDDLKTTKPLFTSLYQSIQKKVIDGDFEYDFPKNMVKVFESVNSVTIPSFRKIVLQDKKDKNLYTVRFDSRLDFSIKINPGEPGYNDKVKEFSLTKQQISASQYKTLDKTGLFTLWGGSKDTPKHPIFRGGSHTGCIFIVPVIELKYYSTGYPTLNWRVDKVALKKRKYGAKASNYGAEIFQQTEEFEEDDSNSDEEKEAKFEDYDVKLEF